MKRTHTDTLAIGWVVTVFLAVFAAFAVANAQAATSVTTRMGPGDSGGQVSALQTFLAADSTLYPEGLVTGYYGDLTTAAVQRYQCKYGIVCQGDPASTGYGLVGPSTLAEIETQEGIAPGDGTPVTPITPQPTTGDVNAPILGAPIVSTTSSSAAISWTTSEQATSRVMYGISWPFLLAAAPSVASANGLSTNATVTMTGLNPSTTYYYVLESIDASGNLQWGFGHSFTTSS